MPAEAPMTPEVPKPVNEASRVLFLQEAQRHNALVQDIAAMARRVDGMPADAVIDLDTLTYVPK